MGKRRLRFDLSRIVPRATDGLLVLVLLIYTLLIAIFNSRVKGSFFFMLTSPGLVFVYLALTNFQMKISNPGGRFFLRIFSVSFLLIYIYYVSIRLSFIFSQTWHDQAIIDLEQRIFGVQPTVWLQRYISPGLTEWLMFSYLFYLPLYPILGAVLFFKRGENQMEDLLFTVSINNILCNIGYFLYPVANPLSHLGHLYSVPLRGYLFTSILGLMRENLMSIGGAMPSGHAAASTIILLMSYRYYRPSFYVLTPIVISIYISLVYCRFHYLSDVVVGILVSLSCWGMVPLIKRKLEFDKSFISYKSSF
jgi:membrane-associated phospholipid phosphatase